MSTAIKLYNFPKSGHAHRIELMLSLLNLPTELVLVDLAKGAHKQPEFLAINPFGQVPVIDDNGTVIADSMPSSCIWPRPTARAAGCPSKHTRPPKCNAGCQWLPGRSPMALQLRGW